MTFSKGNYTTYTRYTTHTKHALYTTCVLCVLCVPCSAIADKHTPHLYPRKGRILAKQSSLYRTCTHTVLKPSANGAY
jgi:hypothetical protein